ncbi:MAG: hypothetical protein Q9167_001314 [Letrouitia subvulpina]
MRFLKQISLFAALGLALVDARAINLNNKRSNELQGVSSSGKSGLQTRAKHKVRGLFGDDSDVEVDKDSSKGNSQKCQDALTKLRKLKEKKVKRGDDDDSMGSNGSADLGPASKTVPMGESLFLSWEEAQNEGIELLGTVGLNSCTGILIIGKQGGIIAHLDPIEAKGGVEDDNEDEDDQEDQDEDMEDAEADEASKEQFKQALAEKVEKLYNDNKDKLTEATMYTLTTSDNLGEEDLSNESAERLQIENKVKKYDVVAEDGMDDDYFEEQRGTLYADIKDKNDIKVKMNGDDP